MLAIISPAKSQDFDSHLDITEHSKCRFIPQAQELIQDLKKLNAEDISKLMKVSDKIGELNRGRFAHWKTPFPATFSRQAIFAFTGEVYNGLQVREWKKSSITQSALQLRILSGLYGLLRPMDNILPYRLEMGTKFANAKGKNLYEFWGNQLTEQLKKDLAQSPSNILVNLASKEYFSVIDFSQFDEVITPHFKERKNDTYKIIGTYAKKARGLMARYIIENKVHSVAKLKKFNTDGYIFSPEQSKGSDLVFTRG